MTAEEMAQKISVHIEGANIFRGIAWDHLLALCELTLAVSDKSPEAHKRVCCDGGECGCHGGTVGQLRVFEAIHQLNTLGVLPKEGE